MKDMEEIEKLKVDYNALIAGLQKIDHEINHLRQEAGKLFVESKRLKLDIDNLNHRYSLGQARELSASRMTGALTPKTIVYDSMTELFEVESYPIGRYVFDVKRRVLIFDGVEESERLSNKEAHLLVLFASNMNTVLEREFVLQTIWNVVTYYSSRSLDVYITRLRKLLSKDENISIYNIHGKGHKLITQP